jgi:hypothetical protein
MNMRVLSVLGAAGLITSVALPAVAVPKAVTPVLPRESVTGVPSHTLPTPPVHPNAFTLPIDVQIVKNDTITSDTPITDKYGIGSDIKVWGAEVQKALFARPKLVRVAGKDAVPFVINKDEGAIVLNANGRAVYVP